MNEELLVAEQIVRLLQGPQGKIWELVAGDGLTRPDDMMAEAAARRPSGRVIERFRPHPDDVAIRDAQGTLVALARPAAA